MKAQLHMEERGLSLLRLEQPPLAHLLLELAAEDWVAERMSERPGGGIRLQRLDHLKREWGFVQDE